MKSTRRSGSDVLRVCGAPRVALADLLRHESCCICLCPLARVVLLLLGPRFILELTIEVIGTDDSFDVAFGSAL
jgi:hypothetical protein